MSKAATPDVMAYRPDFTLAHIVRVMRALAAEHPKTVYKRPAGQTGSYYDSGKGACWYVHETAAGTPRKNTGCIVGRALQRLGVPPEWFAVSGNNRGVSASAMLRDLFGDRFPREADRVRTPEAYQMQWIRDVQSQQDGGAAWGPAVRYADDRTVESAMQMWDVA